MNIIELKEYTKMKHNSQLRKNGTPYYLHPFAVAELLEKNGYDINYQVTGLFHDLLEDTDTTYEDIKSISNERIADAVKLLTKEKNYNMDNYIFNIKHNEIAKAVKLADRIHNLSETHLASIDFRKKYVDETKRYYIGLSKGTVFETKLIEVLEKVESGIK